MAKSSKPTILKNNGKSPLFNISSSASKIKSPLMPAKKNKNSASNNIPDQAFEIPGFGNTGLTGES